MFNLEKSPSSDKAEQMQNNSFSVCLVCMWDCNIASLRFAHRLQRSTKLISTLFSNFAIIQKTSCPEQGSLICKELEVLTALPSNITFFAVIPFHISAGRQNRNNGP